MKVQINKTYGGSQLTFELEATDLKEALFKSSIFTMKDRCTKCTSEKISMTGNKDKDGNLYVKRHCDDCSAESSLGTFKSGGYFWHQFEVWKKSEDKASY